MQSILDLELLNTFAVVARTGEFKQAAQVIHRSQGAVSMQIKRLEALVGHQLIIRSNRGIRLTKQGDLLLSYSKQMLNLNRATMTALQSNQLSGNLNIGIPTDYAQDFLQYFMPMLNSEFPNLKAKLFCERSRVLRKKIAAGKLDIAIVSGEENSFDELQLWQENLIWSAPSSLELDTLTELPVALFDDDCILRDYAQADLAQSTLPYQTILASTLMDNLVSAVHLGYAVSLLPESLLIKHRSKALPAKIINTSRSLSVNLIHNQSISLQIIDRISECMSQAAQRLN